VNCTFYDALARDDRRYLLARLVQLAVPGMPQVYYVGLLAGGNDMDLLRATGVGRDVNRHRYPRDEVERELQRPVVRAQLTALRLRREHPAFGGQFSWSIDGTRAELTWSDAENRVELVLDVSDATFELRATGSTGMAIVLTDRSA
jgi:sucrose phosphorylase